MPGQEHASDEAAHGVGDDVKARHVRTEGRDRGRDSLGDVGESEPARRIIEVESEIAGACQPALQRA